MPGGDLQLEQGRAAKPHELLEQGTGPQLLFLFSNSTFLFTTGTSMQLQFGRSQL